jgi:FxsC-like protein
VKPLGPETGGDAPYFFLSYAHMPRPVGDDATDPNLWIEQLFRDLCRRVREMATEPPPQIGFMDSGIRHGAEWARVLSENLAVCKTFVPLYSPHYFLSDDCGREWHAFCRRVLNGHAKGTGPIEQIIPAQWIPVPIEHHPRAVQRIQFRPAELGMEYAEHGFYPLTHIGLFRSAYDLAVYELARKIVTIAQGDPAPPGPALDYISLPSAFTDGDGPVMRGDKPFHIVIAAPHLADLPPGRTGDFYGADAYGWNPYVPDVVEPLAQYARKVARHQGHRRPQVYSLTDYEGELLRDVDEQAAAPAVLIIDPWAVAKPECRRLLEAYDQMSKPWIQFVVAWNTKDVELAEAEDMLRGLLSTVLRNKLAGGGRPARQMASLGVTTIEEMSVVLPSMIQTAGRHFLRHQNPPVQSPAARLRLPGGAGDMMNLISGREAQTSEIQGSADG